MIIYNQTWLNNLKLHHQFEEDEDAGCLTAEEVKRLKALYPVGFYMTGIVVKIGLFILTVIIVLFSLAFLSLFVSEAKFFNSEGWLLLLGIIVSVILERLVKEKHYYSSGVDNALLYFSAGLIAGGFTWIISPFEHYIFYKIALSAFVMVLCGYLTLRFADLLTSAIGGMAFLSLVFFTWYSLGSFGITTMPFIMMIASAVLYTAAVKWYTKPSAVNYSACLNIVKLVGLLAFYASGNYFVVQQLSAELTGAASDAPVPFGIIFWILTIVTPFAYIAWGIKNRDIFLMRTGLLLIAAAVYTFRYFYHVMPVELALTIGGIVLLGISYAIIKYLKTPKNGFTYTENKRKNILDQLNIESILVGETFSQTPGAPTGPDSPFGGGSAGGGGSSSGY
jgi:hypothetical protein